VLGCALASLYERLAELFAPLFECLSALLASTPLPELVNVAVAVALEGAAHFDSFVYATLPAAASLPDPLTPALLLCLPAALWLLGALLGAGAWHWRRWRAPKARGSAVVYRF